MTNDLINGLIEVGFITPSLVNLLQLMKDKELKGSNVWTMPVWSLYGIWFTYFYANLHQFWSMTATIVSTVFWTIYTTLAFYYVYRSK
jgi:hypothetical protein